MSQKIPLTDINAMPTGMFVDCFGAIAEHSPWVAERAADQRPFKDLSAMVDAFHGAVTSASTELRLQLLRAHPDLAGKAKEIAEDSRREQKAAGLDGLSGEELARFRVLNASYRCKFGFPFIFAVRGATKQKVFDAFKQRLRNSAQVEFDNAVLQVCAILRFRLEDRIEP